MLANQVMTSEYIADIDCVIRMLRIGKNLSYKYPQFRMSSWSGFWASLALGSSWWRISRLWADQVLYKGMIFSIMISKIAIVNIWLVDICDKYPVRTKIIRIRTEFAIQLQYQEYWADQDSSYMKNFKIFGWLVF